MSRRAGYVGGFLAVVLASTAAARADFADWTTTNAGSAGPLALTMTALTAGPELSLSNYDLTDAPYLVFPGAGDQECLNFLCTDDWLATFNQSATNVKLFAVAWRGDGGSTGSATIQYTFNRPFSILCGFSGASVSGSTLSLPGDALYDGILQFNGAFNSLAVSTNADLENAQAMTFAAEIIPEPALSFVLAIVFPIMARSVRPR